MNTSNKIACLRCLSRKEKIDRMERDLLMLEVWIKHLREDITSVWTMKTELEERMATIKKDWETEFIGCIEK